MVQAKSTKVKCPQKCPLLKNTQNFLPKKTNDFRVNQVMKTVKCLWKYKKTPGNDFKMIPG